jgi:Predicted phosphatase/phosphohexomutase
MRRRGEIATDFFANRVGLFPSAKTTLEQLREMKLHLAVATSSVSASARPLLERTGIRSLFSVVVTGDEVQQGKPHPEIYLRAQRNSESLLRHASSSRTRLPVSRGESREHACRRHSRQALCGSAEYEKEANYVLGSLSEIPALIRRVNAAASEEHVSIENFLQS